MSEDSSAQTAEATSPVDPETARRFYIDGAWVEPLGAGTRDVVNPATEEAIATIALGGPEDVDRAVAAAARAFETFSATTPAQRADLLAAVIAGYERRIDDVADAVRQEMGAPIRLARGSQAPIGLGHLRSALASLEGFAWEETIGTTTIAHEPIGVCGFITPWNWPLNQIAAKVAPALAAGCTMVLKPSEIAPLNAIVFAEILDEAGVPAGVFNLVNGDGPTVGAALASHPGIDFISFTGSTRAGIEVARNAAATVKRVAQELGGKSANIILDDADLEQAVGGGVAGMYVDSRQSCNAGSRMLVPRARMGEAIEIARATTERVTVGAPEDRATAVGPVVSGAQFDKIQGLLAKGIEEGATVWQRGESDRRDRQRQSHRHLESHHARPSARSFPQLDVIARLERVCEPTGFEVIVTRGSVIGLEGDYHRENP